jgi:nucleoside 2-deoxyribosyltransferase
MTCPACLLVDEKTYIYVAGPMRAHLEKGIHDACKVADVLLKAGIIPFLPQVNALWNMIVPHENDEEIYRIRLPFDFAWIDKCHGLLRLPGTSPGSDKEVAYTHSKGKPVFYTVEEVLYFDVERRRQRPA